MRKIARDTEQDVGHLEENFALCYIRTCVNVQTVDPEIMSFNQIMDIRKLKDRNAEFRVAVPGGDLVVSASHDVWIQPYAAWISPLIFLAEFLEHRKVVEVDSEV